MAPQKPVIVTYRSNNSGGGWWLSADDWHALDEAGWNVHWFHPKDIDHGGYEGKGTDDDPHTGQWTALAHDHTYGLDSLKLLPVEPTDERHLGASAVGASIEVKDPDTAVRIFERATGQDASAEGCNCCGEPHRFTWTDADGEYHYSSVEVVSTELRWS